MKKQIQFIKNSLMQGTDPHQLSLTFIFAVLIGLIPIWGVSSLILTFLALRLRLNLVLIQSISWLITPFQLMFMYFFFQLGNEIMGEQAEPIDLEKLKNVWEQGWLHTIHFVYQMHVYAFLLWLMSASVCGFILYPILKKLFVKFKKG